MTKDKAIKHLTTMMVTIQKLRSICDETGIVSLSDNTTGIYLTQKQAELVWKYIWGKSSILPILARVLDAPETLNGQLFWNLMYIAIELEPMIGVSCRMVDSTFPEKVSLDWLYELGI